MVMNKPAHKLAFCAVVKDNQDNLERMLNSLEGIFREIIIVDTGSPQKSIDFLKKKATKFFQKQWNDDFATLRNFVISQADSEWIFTLDSDEAASKNLIKAIPSLILNNEVEGYRIPRIHYYGEKNPLTDYWKHLRLYRSKALYFGAVHESIKNLDKIGVVEDLTKCIYHYNSRSYQKEKSIKYSQYLRDKISTTVASGDKSMQEYYKYKLWVQDNVYLLETDPDIDKTLLKKRYKEYEKRKKSIDTKIKNEKWDLKK
jgi:glycosyltransferase involved in cell wall biosynthesis